MKRFNVNAVRTVALSERPLLARSVRPLRALRDRRGQHRVARVLRRALRRPALPGGVARARREHGRARQEPSQRDPLVARQRERLRTAITTPRPAGCASATRRGRCTTRARSGATGAAASRRPTSSARCIRSSTAIVAWARDGDGRPAADDHVRVLARDGQLERRARRLLRRVRQARRAAGRLHLGVGRPRHQAARPPRPRVLGLRRRLRRDAARRELLRRRHRLARPHAASRAERAQVPRAADPRRPRSAAAGSGSRTVTTSPASTPIAASGSSPSTASGRAAATSPRCACAPQESTDVSLRLAGRFRRALRHVPLLPARRDGLGARRTRGRVAAAQAAVDADASARAGARSGRRATGRSRPAGRVPPSTPRPASSASSPSTDGTC